MMLDGNDGLQVVAWLLQQTELLDRDQIMRAAFKNLPINWDEIQPKHDARCLLWFACGGVASPSVGGSVELTSELPSRRNFVCLLLL